MVTIKNLITSTLLFLLYNGGELHQLYSVKRTGCSVGLLPARFGALCFSHLVAAATNHNPFDRESLGLVLASLQHGYLLILTLEATSPLLLVLLYLVVGAGLRWYRSLGYFLYNLTPIYTTAAKVLQLYENQKSGHTGMLSPISTLHILLLSIHYLLKLPSDNIKIRIILVVCFVTNLVQLGQCWVFWEETSGIESVGQGKGGCLSYQIESVGQGKGGCLSYQIESVGQEKGGCLSYQIESVGQGKGGCLSYQIESVGQGKGGCLSYQIESVGQGKGGCLSYQIESVGQGKGGCLSYQIESVGQGKGGCLSYQIESVGQGKGGCLSYQIESVKQEKGGCLSYQIESVGQGKGGCLS
ncbi:uncharacterized protein LOC134811972 [Bolinopsis microptera]|uniref:uncharacterized protein LOC134811972 n=1 Tax=Bolinopsis microptera TaxID=2820187 RepID=UPI00307A6A07